MRARYEESTYTGYVGKADFRNQSVISSRPVTVVSSTIHGCHTSIQTHTTRIVPGEADEFQGSEPPSPTSSTASRYDTMTIDDLDIIKTIGN